MHDDAREHPEAKYIVHSHDTFCLLGNQLLGYSPQFKFLYFPAARQRHIHTTVFSQPEYMHRGLMPT